MFLSEFCKSNSNTLKFADSADKKWISLTIRGFFLQNEDTARAQATAGGLNCNFLFTDFTS